MMLPDMEVLTVQWAKDNAPLNALLNGRASTNLPHDPFGQEDGATPITDPYMTVFRIGGSPENTEGSLLIDRALLQCDFWGGVGDYRGASEAARTFVEEAHMFTGTVSGSGSGWSINGWVNYMDIVTGPRRLHEPETGWARFVVELFVSAREG